MSDTSYDCYYEKHFALHSLSGVKHCAFEMLSHTFQQISGMFLVCSQFTPYCLSRVVLDSREFSSTMLPMCSDIFIRSTIYLLGVWRNRRSYIYISTLCQYLDTDCDQVYRDEQGGRKIHVYPSQGCSTR